MSDLPTHIVVNGERRELSAEEAQAIHISWEQERAKTEARRAFAAWQESAPDVSSAINAIGTLVLALQTGIAGRDAEKAEVRAYVDWANSQPPKPLD